MNQMDDLFSRFSKLYPVLGQSKFVLVSDVLPQSWHGIDGVTDTAEDFDWKKRIVAELLWSLHFARFFWNILARSLRNCFVFARFNGSFCFAHSQVDCFAWSFEWHFGLGVFSAHLHWRTVDAELMKIQRNVQVFIRKVPGRNSWRQSLKRSLNHRKAIIGFNNNLVAQLSSKESWPALNVKVERRN